jgi:hypothetical protein
MSRGERLVRHDASVPRTRNGFLLCADRSGRGNFERGLNHEATIALDFRKQAPLFGPTYLFTLPVEMKAAS